MSHFLISNNFKQNRHHTNVYLYRFMAGIFEHILIIKSSWINSHMDSVHNPNISEG